MNEHFIKLLWSEFRNKIHQDWQNKYSTYGTLTDIKQQTNLAKAIEHDIYSSLNISRREKGRVPSWSSINTYLTMQSFGTQPKNKTLNTISKYIGYDSYEDFKINSKRAVSLAQAIPKLESNNLPLPKQKKGMAAPILLCTGLALFIIVGFVIFQKLRLNHIKSNEISRDEISEIKDIIEKANKLEFELYAGIPELKDTNLLSSYYAEKGVGRIKLIELLERIKLKGTILDRDESIREINFSDKPFEFINDGTLKVITVEKWKLHWRDSITSETTHIYDVLNSQVYHLTKYKNGWKIDDNIYKGKAE